MRVLVELSAENLPLAQAELSGAAEAVVGHRTSSEIEGRLAAVELPGPRELDLLAGRLALARRIIEPIPDGADERSWIASRATPGASAAFRPLHTPRGGHARPAVLDRWVAAWKGPGGVVALDAPEHRFVWEDRDHRAALLGVERRVVDRRAMEDRRMPKLSFRRPVSLPPKLGRVAVNLASVRPGELVVDPFLGTGSLLLEAAILGARVSGVDLDDAMVRGALANFHQFGATAERLFVADAAAAAGKFPIGSVDVLLTDPPYGRASGTRGEPPSTLVPRVLEAWSDRLTAAGRIVVVVPGGPTPAPPGWTETVRIPDRVHRSLTREFCVLRRAVDSS